jgi:hypothetical protein
MAASLFALAVLTPDASAEVLNVSANGFAVKHEVTTLLTPEQTYALLVDRVGEWWNPAHTFSGNAKNLSIDAKPGGCFCERFPGGGGVQHMTVTFARPGRMLRMSGALGPMQGSGLAGSMSWQLEPVQAGKPGTKLTLSYSVGGYLQGGFEQMAPAVDGVLGEQIGRLQRLADTGKPD